MTPDAQTLALFRHLWRGGRFAYFWTESEEDKPDSEKPERLTFWFPLAHLDLVEAPSQMGVAGLRHIYYGVHPVGAIPHREKEGRVIPAEYTRATLADVVTVNALFGDFDDKSLEHIESCSPRPTALIESSPGKYQALWLLDAPFLLTDDSDRDRVKGLQYAWNQLWQGDKQVKDFARVLRVPGTRNVKGKYGPNYPTAVWVWFEPDRVYSIESLEARVAPLLAQQAALDAPEQPPERQGIDLRGDTDVTPKRAEAYVRAALNAQIHNIESCPDGARHWTRLHAGLKLGSLLHYNAIPESEIRSALVSAARLHSVNPSDAERDVHDGLDRGQRRPYYIPLDPRRGSARAPLGDLIIPEEERWTDKGNARRLLRLFGPDLRWAIHLKHWLIWQGEGWEVDQKGAVLRMTDAVTEELLAAASQIEDTKERAKAIAFAHRTENAGRIDAMEKVARTCSADVPVTSEDLDRHPHLLPCFNGVIDLRTGEMQEHNRDLLYTKTAPVRYDPAAECPIWLRFLDRIFDGDTDLIAFLQTAIGYSLTGETRAEVLFFCYGSGRNGKSTLLNTVYGLLGGYSIKIAAESLLSRGNAGREVYELADIPGKRYALASELEDRRLNEAMVKNLASTDPIKARQIYGLPFSFRPTHKLWMYGNHKPAIHGTDTGIWRRMLLIPFTVTIPEAEKDEALIGKLFEESPGILAWAVAGAQRWYREGLTIPDRVRAATAEYRESQDVIGLWLEQCCLIDRGATESASALYASYSAWCGEAGERYVSQRAFGQSLADRGFARSRDGDGRVRREGLKLNPATQPLPTGVVRVKSSQSEDEQSPNGSAPDHDGNPPDWPFGLLTYLRSQSEADQARARDLCAGVGLDFSEALYYARITDPGRAG